MSNGETRIADKTPLELVDWLLGIEEVGFQRRVAPVTYDAFGEQLVNVGVVADKLYAVSSGFVDKLEVNAAAQGNVALTGIQTIDGVAGFDGMRVLLSAQTTPSQNGVWSMASGAWTRTTDMDEAAEFINAVHLVIDGAASAGWSFKCISTAPITVGTTPIYYVRVRGPVPSSVVDPTYIQDQDVAGTASDVWLEDAAGNIFPVSASPFVPADGDAGSGNGILIEDEAGNLYDVANSASYDIVTGGSTENYLSVQDAAGNIHIFGESSASDTTTVSADAPLFTSAEYQYVNDRAKAKALALNSEDVVTNWAAYRPGANCRMSHGQSFSTGSAIGRLLATTSWMAIKGWHHNAWSIGPDSRCVTDGTTYVTYNADTRALFPLQEQFTYPTNTDNIYSAGDVATGNYATNAHGSAPETIAEIVFNHGRQEFLQSGASADTTRYSIVTNASKTDGSLLQITTGNSYARSVDTARVVKEAVQALNGAAPSTVGVGNTDPMHCDFLLWNHGEATFYTQETPTFIAGNAAQYITMFCDFDDALYASMQAQFGTTVNVGQDKRHRVVMLQAGGSRYAPSSDPVTQMAMVDMMINRTGRNLGKFLVGCKYGDVPSPHYLTTAIPGWPFDNNAHPLQAGVAMMGIRFGIAMLYLSVFGESYWVPFPYEVFYRDKRFLIGVPCKFPPLREKEVIVGHTPQWLTHRGITFESGSGTETPVTMCRVVQDPRYGMLIEGTCAEDISGYTVMRSGKRSYSGSGTNTPNYPNVGCTNFLDQGPNLETPIELAFNQNNTVGASLYKDNPATNTLGKFLENIMGFVGKPELGNWMAIYKLTAQPLPLV